MSTRPAPETELDTQRFGVPITNADWAAMSDAERTAIEVGIAELDRGEFVTQDEMKLYFAELLERIAAR